MILMYVVRELTYCSSYFTNGMALQDDNDGKNDGVDDDDDNDGIDDDIDNNG